MTQDSKIVDLGDKIRLLAQDIYDAAVLINSLELEHYVPSKQIQNLLDEEELNTIINYLRKHRILTSVFRKPSVGFGPKIGYQPYRIRISQPSIRRLLGLKDVASKPAEGGIKLHPEFSFLIINGTEIPLAKGKLHKSLQYWVCYLCLKKPNIPVQETNIMAKYATDYDITARSRAIRDAVYKINPKVKKVTGIDELFTYSNGYVVFNADKLK